MVVVNHVEEFQSHILAWLFECAMFRLLVKDVNAFVLVMKSFIQDPAANTGAGKHATNEGFELDVAVIQFWRDRTLELHLV